MGVLSIPSRETFPTKPRNAYLSQGSAVSGTLYTVLNVTGRGKLNFVKNYYYGSSISSTNLWIKITIDGIESLFSNANPGVFGYVPSSGTTGIGFDYISNLNFISSCKVEIMQDAGSTYGIYGNAQYAIE